MPETVVEATTVETVDGKGATAESGSRQRRRTETAAADPGRPKAAPPSPKPPPRKPPPPIPIPPPRKPPPPIPIPPPRNRRHRREAATAKPAAGQSCVGASMATDAHANNAIIDFA